jgi:alpha-beta hydrolase superfamily lysophospholipase
MKFFSGFGFENEKNFFADYIEDNTLTIAGFSMGACKALEYALTSERRVDKLQLFSPSFFKNDEKFKKLQLLFFKKDKKNYINNFLENIKNRKSEKYEDNLVRNEEVSKYFNEDLCTYEELKYLLYFDWNRIKELQNIKIEIFIGSEDKIIEVDEAVEFFRQYGEVYYIKDKGHIL